MARRAEPVAHAPRARGSISNGHPLDVGRGARKALRARRSRPRRGRSGFEPPRYGSWTRRRPVHVGRVRRGQPRASRPARQFGASTRDDLPSTRCPTRHVHLRALHELADAGRGEVHAVSRVRRFRPWRRASESAAMRRGRWAYVLASLRSDLTPSNGGRAALERAPSPLDIADTRTISHARKKPGRLSARSPSRRRIRERAHRRSGARNAGASWPGRHPRSSLRGRDAVLRKRGATSRRPANGGRCHHEHETEWSRGAGVVLRLLGPEAGWEEGPPRKRSWPRRASGTSSSREWD